MIKIDNVLNFDHIIIINMNSLTSFLVKRKVKNALNTQEEETPGVGEAISDFGSEAKEKCQRWYQSSKKWLTDQTVGPECKKGWCHERSEKDSEYCQHHKCHKCSNVRERPSIYCTEHNPL